MAAPVSQYLISVCMRCLPLPCFERGGRDRGGGVGLVGDLGMHCGLVYNISYKKCIVSYMILCNECICCHNLLSWTSSATCTAQHSNTAQHKKASNHHANLPLEMYSFTL